MILKNVTPVPDARDINATATDETMQLRLEQVKRMAELDGKTKWMKTGEKHIMNSADQAKASAANDARMAAERSAKFEREKHYIETGKWPAERHAEQHSAVTKADRSAMSPAERAQWEESDRLSAEIDAYLNPQRQPEVKQPTADDIKMDRLRAFFAVPKKKELSEEMRINLRNAGYNV